MGRLSLGLTAPIWSICRSRPKAAFSAKPMLRRPMKPTLRPAGETSSEVFASVERRRMAKPVMPV
ncbi:hypothetical protein D3C86_1904420 [compost metagenome]